jgi:hypothetical protein
LAILFNEGNGKKVLKNAALWRTERTQPCRHFSPDYEVTAVPAPVVRMAMHQTGVVSGRAWRHVEILLPNAEFGLSLAGQMNIWSPRQAYSEFRSVPEPAPPGLGRPPTGRPQRMRDGVNF